MLLLAAVLRWRTAGPVRLPWGDRAVWLRAACELGVAMCFFRALAALPLAEATAILFVFPVLLTVLAGLVLREWVGWRRWSAVLAGLAGVLLILRPGTAAFDPAAGWSLAAAVAVAARDLVTRYVRPDATTESVALMTTGVTTAAGLATWAAGGWAPVDGAAALGFAATAALVSAAFLCLVAGTRTGDVSFTAPFRYVTVPVSFLLGWVVWGAFPDAFVLGGTAVVVGAGLVTLGGRPRAGAGDGPAPSG